MHKLFIIVLLVVLFAIVAGLVAITPAAFADHSEVTVIPTPGSGTPGCEETAEGCYIPKEATVDVGGTVIFSNTDTAAHTFTAGSAADGPSGAFDSSLVIAGSSYEWKPTTAGSFPFYCMVHQWMAGLIVVEEAGHDDTTSPSDEKLMVDIATGSAGQGEKLSIDLTFTTISGASVEHLNYDIKATQNGKVVLNEMGVHAMDNVNNHMTSPLPAAATETEPVNVEVTFKGYGVPGSEMTGPVGHVTTKQVVGTNIFENQMTKPISVFTNKIKYNDWDTIIVTGKVREFLPRIDSGEVPVSLTVIAPNGNLVTIEHVEVNSDKTFSIEITPNNALWKFAGMYTVKVVYGSQVRVAQTTFEFSEYSGTPEVNLENEAIITPTNSQTLPTEKGTLDVKLSYDEIIPGQQTKLNIDFINPQTKKVQEHIDYKITVSKDDEIVFGPIPLTHTSIGSVKIPVEFVDEGVYSVEFGIEGILFQPIPSENVSFDVVVGESSEPQTVSVTIPTGTSSPGCETFNACYSPASITINAGDTVVWINADSAAHTVTGGTPSEGPSGTFDSGLMPGYFKWTSTTEGEFPYYCMVHPWMAGIIFVGEGTYIPPQPEDNFDLQVIMGNQVYDLSDTATINFSIDGISTPQNVALEISDPSGTSIISRSFMVDSEGIGFEFRIDENFKTGTYKVVATTSDNGNTVTDTAYFKVKSQYNSFKITSVQVTDQQGNPSNLQAGEIGFIKVNLEASKSITTLVTVNLFDSDLTSIGIGSIKTTLSSGNSEIILSFMIPSDVAVGSANIYVNAFSDWPSNGGIPLTGEISIMENIE